MRGSIPWQDISFRMPFTISEHRCISLVGCVSALNACIFCIWDDGFFSARVGKTGAICKPHATGNVFFKQFAPLPYWIVIETCRRNVCFGCSLPMVDRMIFPFEVMDFPFSLSDGRVLEISVLVRLWALDPHVGEAVSERPGPFVNHTQPEHFSFKNCTTPLLDSYRNISSECLVRMFPASGRLWFPPLRWWIFRFLCRTDLRKRGPPGGPLLGSRFGYPFGGQKAGRNLGPQPDRCQTVR